MYVDGDEGGDAGVDDGGSVALVSTAFTLL